MKAVAKLYERADMFQKQQHRDPGHALKRLDYKVYVPDHALTIHTDASPMIDTLTAIHEMLFAPRHPSRLPSHVKNRLTLVLRIEAPTHGNLSVHATVRGLNLPSPTKLHGTPAEGVEAG